MHRDQMELDSALSQMRSLLTNPSLVFKISKARKMTKNHYYRDDPAFVVLQVVFIAIMTLLFGLVMSARPLKIVYTVIYECGINYLVVGALVASGMWLYTNRFLMGAAMLHEVRKEVEWQYCFDVHCNSYFPYFVLTHVIHFVLLPVVSGNSFLSRLIANALYAAGASAYLFVSFKGYLELPMLHHQQLILYPIAFIVVLAAVGTLVTSINMSHVVTAWTWPPD